MFSVLAESQTTLITLIGILGLIFGSFFNVVIIRLPKMLFISWQKECYEFLKLPNKSPDTRYNLCFPKSHCCTCGTLLRIRDNIPILSYIFLGGKCFNCKTKISIIYPCVELLTGLIAMHLAYHFGFSWQAAASIILCWAMICQSFIDINHKIIPDQITIPLLWIGLIVNYFAIFQPLDSAVIGAILGYLSLWSIYWLFKIVTGKEGMGYGDFKLLAMLGAWLGWQALPLIIMLSALLGSCIGVIVISCQKFKPNVQIPFGPYIAMAGWVALLYGGEINHWYLTRTGII